MVSRQVGFGSWLAELHAINVALKPMAPTIWARFFMVNLLLVTIVMLFGVESTW